MGLVLLLLRFGVKDSFLFLELKNNSEVVKGNFFMFFNNTSRLKRYFNSILLGLPVYFVIALLIQSAKDLGGASNLTVTSGKATIVCYMAFAISDFFFTHLSSLIKSRKKIFQGLHLLSFIMLLVFVFVPNTSTVVFYTKYALFGIAIGYWGLLTVNASEQFGTNMRALASTTILISYEGLFILLEWHLQG
jgi:putative MFS transporter